MKLIVAPHAEEVLKLEQQLGAELNERLAREVLAMRIHEIPDWAERERAREAWAKYAGAEIDTHLLQVRALQRAAWLTTAEAC